MLKDRQKVRSIEISIPDDEALLETLKLNSNVPAIKVEKVIVTEEPDTANSMQ